MDQCLFCFQKQPGRCLQKGHKDNGGLLLWSSASDSQIYYLCTWRFHDRLSSVNSSNPFLKLSGSNHTHPKASFFNLKQLQSLTSWEIGAGIGYVWMARYPIHLSAFPLWQSSTSSAKLLLTLEEKVRMTITIVVAKSIMHCYKTTISYCGAPVPHAIITNPVAPSRTRQSHGKNTLDPSYVSLIPLNCIPPCYLTELAKPEESRISALSCQVMYVANVSS